MLSSEKDRYCFDFGQITLPGSSPYGGQMIRCLETLRTKTRVKNFIDENTIKIGVVVTGILGSLLKQANPERCGGFLS